QEARTVSNDIAEHYNVRHESPQVLFIQDGKSVWTASHYDITKDALETNVK
ncbi:monothiol bacilliredoxin BrxC family protein, partial [Exiguobacterium sp.]|uniref:monothiol bacilliredoxin BrxC family protein n=1 Tax=Exiguobacterium sp. TaxID=44751 RepID=UPI00289C8C14